MNNQDYLVGTIEAFGEALDAAKQSLSALETSYSRPISGTSAQMWSEELKTVADLKKLLQKYVSLMIEIKWMIIRQDKF